MFKTKNTKVRLLPITIIALICLLIFLTVNIKYLHTIGLAKRGVAYANIDVYEMTFLTDYACRFTIPFYPSEVRTYVISTNHRLSCLAYVRTLSAQIEVNRMCRGYLLPDSISSLADDFCCHKMHKCPDGGIYYYKIDSEGNAYVECSKHGNGWSKNELKGKLEFKGNKKLLVFNEILKCKLGIPGGDDGFKSFIKNLHSKTELDERNQNGDTPLLFCMKFGVYRIAHDLIDCGASVNVKNNSGMTPLLYSLVNDYGKITLKMVKSLMDAGADPEITDKDGENAFSYLEKDTWKDSHFIKRKIEEMLKS